VTTFADILRQSENPVAPAMLLMLSWIASSDGEIDKQEMSELRLIAEAGEESARLSRVIDISQRCRVEDLLLACEVLKSLEPKQRRLMLQMAIGMALQDGYLTTAEGHIIRLLADVLGQTTSDLDRLFYEITGEPFPLPSDPSSVEWWEGRQSRARSRSQESRSNSQTSSKPGTGTPSLQRLKDLGVLGLDETATISEVKEAYRRMAHIHHPDKFMTLGSEAVKAAEVTFRRIRAAYDRLVAE